jgi:hypothetical protein
VAWDLILQGTRLVGDSTSGCKLSYSMRCDLLNTYASYNILKRRASGGDVNAQLSVGSYLLCSAEASMQLLSCSRVSNTEMLF